MHTPDNNNEDIHKNLDEISAERSDANEAAKPMDEGFKTGKKSHGMTWEKPMDEQAFDSDNLRMNPEDEEAD